MIKFDMPLPQYHNEKKNIVRLVLFTSLFALVFINIYEPFGAARWFSVTPFQFFTYSSLTILTGVLIVVISRIIMYNYCKRHTLFIWQFIAWVFAEILFMALFYSLFEKFVLYDDRDFETLLKMSSRNTALVLLLPYAISWLWLSWHDKKEQLARMTSMKEETVAQDMIAFFDEKGVLKFSVKKENILYVESAENYVNICYMNKDKVSKYLIRETLKKLEQSLEGTGIVRCHRCYMVNFDKVRVIRRDKEGLKLELNMQGLEDIPVSKTYIGTVMQTFTAHIRN
ncbi:MAG TPA: LytTR family DNA-binding domain-containing protein [Bacteroidales bacterium]|nr:LytTR family DNA-binding domain-containing protein [Bacteroidales bacterium]